MTSYSSCSSQSTCIRVSENWQTGGGCLTPWICFGERGSWWISSIFVMIMVRLQVLHATKNWSTSSWPSSKDVATSAASSTADHKWCEFKVLACVSAHIYIVENVLDALLSYLVIVEERKKVLFKVKSSNSLILVSFWY